MSKLIDLTIDDKSITVPEGTLIVDAAKQAGIDIPVFCYHPKLKPAGMCRMCLVEIGRPAIDRATGQLLLQADGNPQVAFGPKLETACTTPVSQGMVVLTTTSKVKAARKEVLEFILTSHPLDCPVCDKGGECPLQNLTMLYGPGQSRFLLDEKMHLEKHVPLGELIYLDRERCIQCGRCVRFQSELVGDAVLGFYNRGRKFEIVTYSDPGFDSYFSGNTTDICPVGALTTADFRFGARPWEMNAAASLCPHCPVGCNLTFNVRREVKSGGQIVIKRVMPRQNEAVNDIWICDKGRFAYQYTESPERLTTPLVRKDGQLVAASWEEALDRAAEGLRQAGKDLLVFAGGRLPNEDLYTLHRLASEAHASAVLSTHMAGGEATLQYGATPHVNMSAMGKGTAILVVASDLYEEAPIWYLRAKQASEQGATLIVANARKTKLDRFATLSVRYLYGNEVEAVNGLTSGGQQLSSENALAAQALNQAEKMLILFGSDGLGLSGSQALAQACAHLCAAWQSVKTPPAGDEPACAILGVWPQANDQGAWELGLRPLPGHAATPSAKALYSVAADPYGDDPAFPPVPFLVVQELFLTATAQQADVVLPAQAFTERDGTYTSGERRVQRFYPAVPARAGCRPDYAITAEIARRLGLTLESRAPSAIFNEIAREIPAFKGLSYRMLAETTPQWPVLSSNLNRKDLYFSGTAYENKQGMGALLGKSDSFRLQNSYAAWQPKITGHDLLAVPITTLYDRGQTVWPSEVLRVRGGNRPGKPWVKIHPADAARIGISDQQEITLAFTIEEGNPPIQKNALALLDETVPTGVLLAPRSFGLANHTPTPIPYIEVLWTAAPSSNG